MARVIVTSSAYSISLPAGTPVAIRVTSRSGHRTLELEFSATARHEDRECMAVVELAVIDLEGHGVFGTRQYRILTEQRSQLRNLRLERLAHPGPAQVAIGARRQPGLVSSICTSPS